MLELIAGSILMLLFDLCREIRGLQGFQVSQVPRVRRGNLVPEANLAHPGPQVHQEEAWSWTTRYLLFAVITQTFNISLADVSSTYQTTTGKAKQMKHKYFKFIIVNMCCFTYARTWKDLECRLSLELKPPEAHRYNCFQDVSSLCVFQGHQSSQSIYYHQLLFPPLEIIYLFIFSIYFFHRVLQESLDPGWDVYLCLSQLLLFIYNKLISQISKTMRNSTTIT